jgi:integrase
LAYPARGTAVAVGCPGFSADTTAPPPILDSETEHDAMASLVRRAQSKEPWQVRYYDHANARRSRQFTRKRDAEAFALEVERAKQAGHLDTLDAGRETVRDYGAKFFAARKPDLAPATAKTLASIWNAHVHDSDLAAMPLRAVRPSDVQAFKTERMAAGVGDGSIRKALGLLSQLFDSAALDRAVTFNPCAPVKRPTGARKGDVQVIAPEAVERLRGHLNAREATYVSAMAYAGLRPEELGALDRRHVGDRSIRVEFACNPDGSLRELKGSGARRSVPLCGALAADLDALDFTGRLFQGDKGANWSKSAWANFRRRRFQPAAAAEKLLITRPYELRHSIASLWLRTGHDPVTVAGWLGHSVIVLQREYAHVVSEIDPADRRSVDELIAAARNGR